MGSGSFSTSSFKCYSESTGRTYSVDTGRALGGQSFTARNLDEDLDPYDRAKGCCVTRECCDSEEHPNTIPVILALDVTGSMGEACKEVVAALGTIMTDLVQKFTDVQVLMMGIGDLDYDRAPIQMSQFESDVRIARWLDKIYLEFGGGGNKWESYTAAWYMGLHHTKLDAYDKRGKKGIIITMGDEMLNPVLPKNKLNRVTGDHLQADVDTNELYEAASKKFDIYHIAVKSPHSNFRYHEERIMSSYPEVLGDNFSISTIDNLGPTICNCIDKSVNNQSTPSGEPFGEPFSNNVITW